MDARVCTPATSLCSRGPIRVLKGASTFSPSCKKAVKRGIIISGMIVGILVAIKKKKEKVRKFSTSLACYDPARVIVASQFPE